MVHWYNNKSRVRSGVGIGLGMSSSVRDGVHPEHELSPLLRSERAYLPIRLSVLLANQAVCLLILAVLPRCA
jgi:hypothetical protein